jgi:hypothetical protein
MSIDVNKIVETLLMNKKILGLVKLMQPHDVVHVLVKDLGLKPQDSARAALGLLKKVNPHFIKAVDAEVKKIKEHPFNPMGKTGYQQGPVDGIPNHQFPPDPYRRNKDKSWPYDDMNLAWQNVKAGPKRGLESMSPGVDGTGIHSKRLPHTMIGDKNGFSSSPPGKEFNLPDEIQDEFGPKDKGAPVPKFIAGRNNGIDKLHGSSY